MITRILPSRSIANIERNANSGVLVAENMICESEEATNSEGIAPARALPQSRRGIRALASLVYRDFKELLLQWRKRSGRWQSLAVANVIKEAAGAIRNYQIK